MAGAMIRFQRALQGHSAAYRYFLDHIRGLIVRNASAVQAESRFRDRPFEPRVEEEFANIVGRANTFIFLFDLLGVTVSGNPLPPSARAQLEKFVYYEQLGDDLGDWRQDYRAGHHTSFLRTCFEEFRRLPSEEELEEFVYLSGVYEKRLVCVIRGFDGVGQHPATREHFGGTFTDYVEHERAKAVGALERFVTEKRRAGVSYG